MSNKPNILQKSNSLRNVIITVLILLIFILVGIILYFMFFKEEKKVINRMPFLELYGNKNVILNKNDSFIEYGYYAYDLEDGDITKKVTIQNHVDIYKPGIYTLSYVINDSNKQSAVKTRSVIVKSDNYTFDFSLKGDKILLLKKGNRYTELGYVATNGNQNLTETVKVFGDVNGDKTGIYTLYYVCENNKEVAVLERKIIVSDELVNINLNDDDLDYISKYNIKELKNNYKSISEHFSSKTMLVLAFSLCKNEGKMTDEEISDCLDSMFTIENNEISHLTSYDLIKGNINFDEASLTWTVSPNLLKEYLEEKLESLKNSLKLSLESKEKLYIYIEDNEYVYKYTFLKQEEKYLFISADKI